MKSKHFAVLLFFLAMPMVAMASDSPNTITFENQSGEFALVKLVGPTIMAVEVPDNGSRTVHVPAGEYYILVQYGSVSQGYHYTKGTAFSVVETTMQYSIITITLHTVINGNYATQPATKNEFDSVIAHVQ